MASDNPEQSSYTPADPVVERDADRVRPGDWPRRTLPSSVTGRTVQFQVVFARGAIEDIRLHGETSPEIEVCGVLVGNIYSDSHGSYCYVEANIRGNHAPGRNAQVTFTSETWTAIHETMDASYPGQRIVGWYHTHPGFGIFLSEMDVFIQENFFSESWQIAYVDDPKGGDRGAFVWQRGVAQRRPYLVDEHNPAPQPASPRTIELLEATAKIRTLQRELQSRKVRYRWFMSLALLWPLVLLGALLFTGVIPPERMRKLVPVQWISRQWKNPGGDAGR